MMMASSSSTTMAAAEATSGEERRANALTRKMNRKFRLATRMASPHSIDADADADADVDADDDAVVVVVLFRSTRSPDRDSRMRRAAVASTTTLIC